MKSKYFPYIVVACLMIFSLNACAFTFNPVSVTDVAISMTENQDMTMNSILLQTNQLVQEYVPGAYASSLTFLGQCKNIDEVVGKINIGYVRVDRRFILHERVIVGMVSVDTLNEMLEMRFEDHTEHYPLVAPPSVLPENLPLFDVAELARNHVGNLAISDCDITLTYLGDTWHVLCTEPESGPLGAWLCSFEIDNATLQILEP